MVLFKLLIVIVKVLITVYTVRIWWDGWIQENSETMILRSGSFVFKTYLLVDTTEREREGVPDQNNECVLFVLKVMMLLPGTRNMACLIFCIFTSWLG